MEVFRGGAEIAYCVPSVNEFTNNTVNPPNTYSYSVYACDTFANCSISSFRANTTTTRDARKRVRGPPPVY